MSQFRLTLMRHGLAESVLPAHLDFERSLTLTGIREVTAMARWYHARDCRPELILTSPAKRTHSTADIMCHQFGVTLDQVRLVPEIYDASMETLLTIIRATEVRITHLFLVGHNPGLDDLARYCLGRMTCPYSFAPGAIIEILFKCDWADMGPEAGILACARAPRDQDGPV